MTKNIMTNLKNKTLTNLPYDRMEKNFHNKETYEKDTDENLNWKIIIINLITKSKYSFLTIQDTMKLETIIYEIYVVGLHSAKIKNKHAEMKIIETR